MARLKFWVWLSCVTGVRPLVKYRLIETMGGPDKVFFADKETIMGLDDLIREKEADQLMDKSMDKASRALAFCEEHEIDVLTVQDARYPERLRHISDPPAVLYVWGKLPPVDDAVTVAVVGTRKATPYGLKMAAQLGRDIARAGGVVVSGLAEGCDAMAMKSAMEAGGVTVGVLGTAIDQVYPAKNRKLFAEVRARGALVSEYPPGARTFSSDFKVRNRIISGLSLGVVVTEAPLHSGTRNTAEHALQQDRDVFAVPGNVDAAASAGCNDLIAHGAIPAVSGAQILSLYRDRFDLLPVKPPEMPPTLIKKEIDKPKDIVYIDLTEDPKGLPADQWEVLKAMTRPDMHPDEIIEATGLPASDVLAALTMLQVAGYVTQGAGRRYTRKR